jgi:hypothetical protein
MMNLYCRCFQYYHCTEKLYHHNPTVAVILALAAYIFAPLMAHSFSSRQTFILFLRKFNLVSGSVKVRHPNLLSLAALRQIL